MGVGCSGLRIDGVCGVPGLRLWMKLMREHIDLAGPRGIADITKCSLQREGCIPRWRVIVV